MAHWPGELEAVPMGWPQCVSENITIYAWRWGDGSGKVEWKELQGIWGEQ